jgi:hypothetical protein
MRVVGVCVVRWRRLVLVLVLGWVPVLGLVLVVATATAAAAIPVGPALRVDAAVAPRSSVASSRACLRARVLAQGLLPRVIECHAPTAAIAHVRPLRRRVSRARAAGPIRLLVLLVLVLVVLLVLLLLLLVVVVVGVVRMPMPGVGWV